MRLINFQYAPKTDSGGINFDPIETGIEAAEGIFKIGAGLIGEGKDKREAALLRKTRPKASLNPEIKSNLALAESELSNPDAAANEVWRESTDSALSNSIGAILKSGGTPNDVASVFSNNAEGRARMLQFQEQLRQQKVANLSNAYSQEAEDEKAVFDYNSRQWYDDAQALALKTQADRGLVGGGASDLFSTASNAATLANQKKQTNQTLADQDKLYRTQQDNFMQQMYEYLNPSSPIPNDYTY